MHVVLCKYCISSVGYRWCYVQVVSVVLCTDDAMYMLDMQCYVPVVLHACCAGGARYIWCGVHDCTSGVVCMW